MTISSQTRKVGPFAGNDTTTVFPFDFKVFQVEDLHVVRSDDATGVETVLALDADYSVVLNGDQNANPGGIVTLPAALAAGKSLVITSELPYLQKTDLTNQGGFYPAVVTAALDRLTIFVQQLAGLTKRSLKAPISDSDVDMTLPLATDRANRYLSFDLTGRPVSTTFDIDAVQEASSAAMTAAGNAAISEANAASSASLASQSAQFAGEQAGFVGEQVAAVTPTVVRFSGDDTKTEFSLPSSPGDEANTQIFISGEYQHKDTYSVQGAKIVFDTAPPTGTSNIEVVIAPSVQLQLGSASGISMVGPDGLTHAMSKIGSSEGSGLVGHSSATTYPANSVGGAVNDFVAGVINTLALDPLDPNYPPSGSIEYLLEDGFNSV